MVMNLQISNKPNRERAFPAYHILCQSLTDRWVEESTNNVLIALEEGRHEYVLTEQEMKRKPIVPFDFAGWKILLYTYTSDTDTVYNLWLDGTIFSVIVIIKSTYENSPYQKELKN
jgi:hypothetical protein